MTAEDFHRRLHELAGEDCMAHKVVANTPFEYGPPVGVAGETLALEPGQVFVLRGFAHDELLLQRHYVRAPPDHAEVGRCPVCGVDFVEGLPEHMSKRHGPQEAA